MTAPTYVGGPAPTGHGARDSAVATRQETDAMKFTPGLSVMLGFGVVLTVFNGEAGPFLGLTLIGYSIYAARKEGQAQHGAPSGGTRHSYDANGGASWTPKQTNVSGQVSHSRQRGYNRLVSIFNAHQVVGLPTDQAVRKLVPFFGDAGFTRHLLNHPNVAPLLRLSAPAAVGAAAMGMATAAPQRDDSWWQDSKAPAAPQPAEPAPGSVEASTGAFWSTAPSAPAESAPVSAASPEDFMIGASGDDVCGAVGCNRTVTDFDYRCFTCRKRFCMTHRGAGVDCPACAST